MFLLAMEWILRVSMKVDSTGFTGPALAATGVGLLIPCTKLRPVVLPGPSSLPRGYVIFSRSQMRCVNAIWFFVLFLTVVWAYTVYLSCTGTAGFYRDGHVFYGLAAYFSGIILAELREVF